MKKRALLAAGGTGGHIIPAIAIGKELQRLGYEVLFVGNKGGMEEKLVKEFPFVGIDVQKLYRKLTLKHILFPYKFIKSIYLSIRIISKFKPDIFVGTGGFVSGPVGIAAFIKKIPVFIQEQNSFPGITNKILGKISKKIFVAYDNVKKYFNTEKILFSGNPINPAVFDSQKIDFEKYKMNEKSFKIFLCGGSQGSRILNQNFFPVIDELLKQGIEIFWQTGKYDYKKYNRINKKGLYIFDFTNEMGKIYNSTDLFIGRAGAITLEEVKAKKIPSLLIPLSIAAGNHQYLNALELLNKGYCEIIEEKDLNSNMLYDNIIALKQNYHKYKQALEKEKIINSAEFIAMKIDQIVHEVK